MCRAELQGANDEAVANIISNIEIDQMIEELRNNLVAVGINSGLSQDDANEHAQRFLDQLNQTSNISSDQIQLIHNRIMMELIDASGM